MAGPLKLKARIQLGESELEVWSDIDSLKRQVASFGKIGVGRANARALNKAAAKSKTFTGKLLQKAFNIKARSVSNKLKINPRATAQKETVAIHGRSTRLSIYNNTKTKPKQTARGARFNAGGGNKVHPHTFVARMSSGHVGVFVRAHKTGRKRVLGKSPTTGKKYQAQLPIRELEYPSVAHMITNEGRANEVFDFFVNDYPRQLFTQLDFELKKSKGVV